VVRGLRVPLAGRVSSDALALDVTDVPGFTVDDEVALLDPVDPAAMTVHDLAALRGTIAWEVLDAFTPRVPRVYTDGGRPVGVRHLDGVTRFVDGW
jgi:alanine racemase